MDSDVVAHLSKHHIDTFIDFFSTIINKRYKSDTHKKKLLSLARIEINSIPLKALIKEYKENLNESLSEYDWSKFLQRNLFLIDPSYIHSFKEIHLTLGAKTRKLILV